MDEGQLSGCDVCGSVAHLTDYCPDLQGSTEYTSSLSLARQTLPSELAVINNENGSTNVVCVKEIEAKTRFGPLSAPIVAADSVLPESCQEADGCNLTQLEVISKQGQKIKFNLTNENQCNWMCLIGLATTKQEQNCIIFQLSTDIYFTTTKPIRQGELLKAWYAKGYARRVGKPEEPVSNQTAPPTFTTLSLEQQEGTSVEAASMEGVDDGGTQASFVYACPFCGGMVCSSQMELEEHMDTCIHKPAVEEVAIAAAETAQSTNVIEQQHLREFVIQQPDQESHVLVEPTPNASSLSPTKQPSKGFACKKCPYTCDTVSSLATHISSAHLAEVTRSVADTVPRPAKKRVWTCSICGIVFSNPRSLGLHKRHHHPKPSNNAAIEPAATDQTPTDTDQMPADTIQIPADTIQILADTSQTKVEDGHDISEDGVREITVIVEQMASDTEQPFSNVGERYGRGKRRRKRPKHLESSVVEIDGVYDCQYCMDMFNSEASLQEHIQSHHFFQCCECNTKFKNEENRARHWCPVGQLHLDIDLYRTSKADDPGGPTHYTCPICANVYDDRKVFYEHLVWHCVNLSCDICRGHWPALEALEEHVKSCSGPTSLSPAADTLNSDTYSCDECGIELYDTAAAQAHFAIHSNYKCPKCDAHFYTRFGIQKHLLSCDQSLLECFSPVFACIECNSVFPSQIALQYHNKEHSDKTHRCLDCLLFYKTLEDFEAHNCQPKEANHSCDICSKGFKTEKSLAAHYIKHSHSFDCRICHKALDSKDELIKHSLECSAQDMLRRLGKINCAHCQKTFQDVQEYRTHLKTHSEKLHECTMCHKRYRPKTTGSLHCASCKSSLIMKKKYQARRPPRSVTTEGNYKCPVCAKLFMRRDFYLNHKCRSADGKVIERSADLLVTDDKDSAHEAVCHQCGKTFCSLSSLSQHVKTHGEKSVFCEVCNKAFYHRNAMLVHYHSCHTNRLRVQCEHCNKSFRNKYSLHTHLKQFHSPNITVYACEICGKKFRQIGNLNKHRLVHGSEKNYRCTRCSKAFKYPEQLKRHSLLHTQGKSIGCRICDRRFVVQYELNKHMKQMHSNKVFVCPCCSETCRWRHTMRRHLQRKHPKFSSMMNCDRAYLTSLLRDISDLQRNQTLLDDQVTVSSTSDGAGLTVISLDGISTPDQIVQLSNEQLVGHVSEEGATIHLYSQDNYLPQAATEALQRLSAANPLTQQPSTGLGASQQYTISFSNGQTILTPIDSRAVNVVAPVTTSHTPASTVTSVNHTGVGMTSLLRTQNTDLSSITQPLVEETSVQQTAASVATDGTVSQHPDGAQVVLNNHGLSAVQVYSAETFQQSQNDATVSFNDITSQLAQSQTDDQSKLMFFNILQNAQDSAS